MDRDFDGPKTAKKSSVAGLRILSLSADAISQIHSSKQITSLQGVVFALLENSLDADANKVDISVSFARGSCTVEDNGTGLPLSEFHETGGLGKMYHTSKNSLNVACNVHGSTGTYLASLSALSFLSITSRHGGEVESATLTMHQAKVIARYIPTPPSHELSIFGTSGTRVTVNDLFGNMPVRIKQRALSNNGNGAADDKTWQELKHGISALLLAWRSPCSVKIHDAEIQGRSLTLCGSHPAVSAALTEKSLNQLLGKPARYDLRDALPIIFQAGLASFNTRTRWVPLSASTLKLSVRGTICLDPAPSRVCQFISLGIHPVSAVTGHSEIYDSVNRIFANSSFGSVEEEHTPIDEVEKDRRKRDRRYKADGYTQKQTRGAKGIDRWPMFVLQANFKNQARRVGAIDAVADHQLKAVIEVLEAMVTQWLTANNFRPRNKRKRKNEQQDSPASAASPNTTRSRSGAGSIETPRVGLSRAATTDGIGSSSRKRRVMDLSGNDVRLEDSPVEGRPSTLDSWSRIKGGRHGTIDEIWESRQAATAPLKPPGPAARTTAKHAENVAAPSLQIERLDSAQSTQKASGIYSTREELSLYEDQQQLDISSDYFGSVSDTDLLHAEGAVPESAGKEEDNLVNWTDPITGQSFRVNSRTGAVLPARLSRPSTSERTPNRASAAINTATTSAGKPLTLARRSVTTPQSHEPSPLPQTLQQWQNPVFARQTEEHIPVASLSGPGVELAELAGRRRSHHDEAQHFSGTGSNGHSNISKAALSKARVINQVDAKFILCSIPSPSPTTGSSKQSLILVDQHAASERVLLEHLLAELCSPIDSSSPAAQLTTNLGHSSAVNTVLLATPLLFDVSPQEHDLLKLHALHFARWGILYDQRSDSATEPSLSQVRPTRPRHRIIARALPPGIAERCTLVPKLLIDLLRSEAWALAQSGRRNRTAPSVMVDDGADEHAWLKHIGSCPKALLDLLNSRACRSAVMFNDVLSVSECEALLRELAQCAFPFMCAHGRVSMVPLVSLGAGDGEGLGFGGREGLLGDGKECEKPEKSFGDAFNFWQGKLKGGQQT